MKQLFLRSSPYRAKARSIAIAWTLFIIGGCLAPARTIPEVGGPLADKWTHFVMFSLFVFLWLCTRPGWNGRRFAGLLLLAAAFGATIELLQGWLVFLGRSMELLDWVADLIGASLGLVLFVLGSWWAGAKTESLT